jgi:DNA-binding transcriptional ArsR family regulator
VACAPFADLKDFFQMSPEPRRIDDLAALKALAHPLRVALLSHLLAAGPSTASACAEAVGSTGSNCSWHLRQLAQHGFVERVEARDGRERPWRSTEVGFALGGDPADPAVRTQQDALVALQLDQEHRLAQAFLDERRELDAAWREASTVHGYTLIATATELAELLERVDGLLRPYLSPVREDAPEGARTVHVGVRAFPR